MILSKQTLETTMEFLNLTPKQNVIDAVVASLPKEFLDAIRADGMSHFDFGMFIVRSMVSENICDLEKAFDTVFGNGMYTQFKNEVRRQLDESLK